MKILMVCTDFPYKSKNGTVVQGGGSACIAQMVDGLLKKGHTIMIVTRFEKDNVGELFAIPIIRTKYIYLGFRESKITHAFFSLAAVRNAIRTFKPDIIHSHNPPAALTVSMALIGQKKTHVLTMHGPWSSVRLGGIKKKLAEQIEKIAVKKATTVACDSNALAIEINEKYEVKTHAIQNAVDEFYFEKIDKETAKDALGIHTTDRIALFTGRFVAEKGLDILLQAASRILKKRNNITFLLIGGGFDEKLVHEWLRNHVQYKNKILTIPFLEHERMKDAYSLADVFVLPSKAEGLSRSLMEAMLFELPCIATNVGGNVELLEEGRGILVKQDANELADAIDTILDKPEQTKKMAQKARSYVINNLTVEKRINKLLTLYQSVI